MPPNPLYCTWVGSTTGLYTVLPEVMARLSPFGAAGSTEARDEGAALRSLQRLSDILDCVAGSRLGVAPSTVADVCDLPLSTAARIMQSMTEYALLVRDAQTGIYRLGPKIASMARASLLQTAPSEAAYSYMVKLRDMTNETVSLHLRTGSSRTCISEVQSNLPVRRVVPVGFSVPLHLGATGISLLSAMGPREQMEYLDSVRGVEDVASIRKRISIAEADGFAMAVDSWQIGLAGISFPIRTPNRQGASMALTVSGPSNRLTEVVMTAFADSVGKVAEEVALHL